MEKQEVEGKKKSRDVVVALNHLKKRRMALLEKREWLTVEIEGLDAAIEALE